MCVYCEFETGRFELPRARVTAILGDDLRVRIYSLRLRVVRGRRGVTFLAAAVLVDVELGAERPQRPLLLESALKPEKRETIEYHLRLREEEKKRKKYSSPLKFKFKFGSKNRCRSVSQCFTTRRRRRRRRKKFKNYRVYDPFSERHHPRFRSSFLEYEGKERKNEDEIEKSRFETVVHSSAYRIAPLLGLEKLCRVSGLHLVHVRALSRKKHVGAER